MTSAASIQATTSTALFKSYCLSRDEAVLRELLKSYYPPAYRLARHILGDPAAAEDAVQNAMIQLIRSADKFQQQTQFDPWSHAILMNAIRMERRSRSRRHNYEQYAASRKLTHVESAAETAQRNAQAKEVQSLMRQLAEDEQTILILHFFERQSQSQIAQILGTSQSTISRKLTNALEQLKSKLTAMGLSVTVLSLTSDLEAMSVAYQSTASPQLASTQELLTLAKGTTSMSKLAISLCGLAVLVVSTITLASAKTKNALPNSKQATKTATQTKKTDQGNKTAQNSKQVGRKNGKKPQTTEKKPKENKKSAAKTEETKPNNAKNDKKANSEPKIQENDQDAPEKPVVVQVSRWCDDYLTLVESNFKDPATRKIEARLQFQLCDIQAEKLDLVNFIDEFSWQTGIKFKWTQQASTLAYRNQAKVSLQLKTVQLDDALRFIFLTQSKFAYKIRRGLIEVLTKKELEVENAASSTPLEFDTKESQAVRETARTAFPTWILSPQKVSLNIKDVPIREALEDIGRSLGINILTNPTMESQQKTVTIQIQEQSLHAALEAIAKQQKCTWELIGDIILFSATEPEKTEVQFGNPSFNTLLKDAKKLSNLRLPSDHKNLTGKKLTAILQGFDQIDKVYIPDELASQLTLEADQPLEILFLHTKLLCDKYPNIEQKTNGRFVIEFPEPKLSQAIKMLEKDFGQYRGRLQVKLTEREKREADDNAPKSDAEATDQLEQRLNQAFNDLDAKTKVLLKCHQKQEWLKLKNTRRERTKLLNLVSDHWPYQPISPESRHEDLFLKKGFIVRLFTLSRTLEGRIMLSYIHGELAREK